MTPASRGSGSGAGATNWQPPQPERTARYYGAGSRQRRTVPRSMSNRSRARPSVWSIISSRLCGRGVEGRDRRHHHRAVLARRRHGAQMAGMQRRLAHEQHQPAAFLERDVRSAGEQVGCRAPGDLRERADRAGRNRHAARAEGAGGDGARDVARVVNPVRERLYLRRLAVGFMRERDLCRRGHHQMRFDGSLRQQLQQADAVNDARGAADADDEAVGHADCSLADAAGSCKPARAMTKAGSSAANASRPTATNTSWKACASACASMTSPR